MKFIFFSILLIAFHNQAFSLNNSNNNVVVCGTINSNTDHSKESMILAKVVDNAAWGLREKTFCKLAHDGTFYIEISVDSLNYYSLSHVNEIGTVKYLANFLLQPGDSINFTLLNNSIDYGFIPKDSILFSGTNAEANTLANILLTEYRKTLYEVEKIPKKVGTVDDLSVYLSTLTNMINHKINEKEKLIRDLKASSPKYKRFMHYQYGNYYTRWFAAISRIYSKCTDGERKEFIKAYFKKNKKIFLEQYPDDISIMSLEYYQYINEAYKSVQLIENGSSRLDLHYELLKENFKGRTLERILLEVFKGAYGTFGLKDVYPAYNSILQDSKQYFVSKRAKELIEEHLRFAKGAEFYNTTFTDLKGNTFDTKSLKGKVFLLDSWGEGCSACAAFHVKFEEEIWPKLEGREDFAVLSVFDGLNMNRWNKLIEGGKYTSKDYINVTTIPLSSDTHPFFKYYGVNYAPFIMLVDKNGKIITHIRPSLSSKEILALINSVSTNNFKSK